MRSKGLLLITLLQRITIIPKPWTYSASARDCLGFETFRARGYRLLDLKFSGLFGLYL